MSVRWFTLAILCAGLVYNTGCVRMEFGLSEMCSNLTSFFKLISSLVTFKARLDFKEGDRHLAGDGNVVFSPNLVIDECEAYKLNSKLYITTAIKGDIIVEFTDRPWVFLNDCMLELKLISQDLVLKSFRIKRKRQIAITKVDVGVVGSATVNGTELDYWSKKSLQKTLGIAFTEFASEVVYDLGSHEELGQSVASEALNSVLQYYIYRLK